LDLRAGPTMTKLENDQTEEHWSGYFAESRGTGIFLVKSVETGTSEKVLTPDLTYAECRSRGERALAFKWVPDPVATVRTLAPCVGRPCVARCAEPGCICDRSAGICR
jgi:hypothetical protein